MLHPPHGLWQEEANEVKPRTRVRRMSKAMRMTSISEIVLKTLWILIYPGAP